MTETSNPKRTCLLTGEEKPQEQLLRFTLTPDRQVIPDFKKQLPGKGFYLTNSRKLLNEAISKNIFRKFGAINLARKAGVLISGFDKVREKLAAGKVAFVLDAIDAGADGHAKICAAAKNVEILTLFEVEELDKALNRTNTVHAALLKSDMAQMVYNQLQRWQNFINS